MKPQAFLLILALCLKRVNAFQPLLPLPSSYRTDPLSELTEKAASGATRSPSARFADPVDARDPALSTKTQQNSSSTTESSAAPPQYVMPPDPQGTPNMGPPFGEYHLADQGWPLMMQWDWWDTPMDQR
ncbi:expressed unknown protein [Seminavis robusta]|uniref:Uncharacterized protein n=1 Tax=Seminavis robusta TaxID=568900 RepID=A0A9N8E847_9STRA|nr:expressed unknown protein [Seminavis robusta]|eukprot:Sro788_g202450.1 n/a (129) ;mRNA; r:1751-2137